MKCLLELFFKCSDLDASNFVSNRLLVSIRHFLDYSNIVGGLDIEYWFTPERVVVVLNIDDIIKYSKKGVKLSSKKEYLTYFLKKHNLNDVDSLSIKNDTYYYDYNINKEEFGFRNLEKLKNIDNESLMLTGDENIVDIDFEIQWRIKNATDYLFNVYNPTLTIRMATESAMREVIGKRQIDDALTTKKLEIEREVLELLQNILDNYKSGIEVILVQLLRVDPPMEVISAFRDVQTAKADKERKINEAETYRNDIIPKTRGEVESIIKNAEGYSETLIKNTEGEIAYFNSLYKEYVKNPQLTKKRIYLETMESVMNNVDKVIINDNIGQNILQHLSINNKSGN